MRAAGVPASDIIVNALRVTRARVGFAVIYHRVGDPPGDPSRELVPNLGARLFDAQLRYLASRYRLVPASVLHEAASSRRRGERFPLAITFDDDLPSHRDTAGAILTRAGVPAAFFACGASLERPFAFWWERLQAAVDQGLVPDIRTDAIHARALVIQTMNPDERDAEAARLEALVGPAPPHAGMRADDVRALAAAGFEIGFHTLRHYWLPRLDDDALARAMHDGREQLASASERELTMIAYPHGGGDERVAAAARAAGYELGFKTSGEAVGPTTDPLLMGRIEPSFESVGHFAFEVAFALLRGRWQPA
jgi:peptidoglycan/xylan/chitin deacetylase (PgdA/CDA1 family)